MKVYFYNWDDAGCRCSWRETRHDRVTLHPGETWTTNTSHLQAQIKTYPKGGQTVKKPYPMFFLGHVYVIKGASNIEQIDVF